MRTLFFVASLALLTFGCGSSDDKDNSNNTPQQDAATEAAVGQDASVQPDAASLPACPEEVKLSGSEFIPCDCYGHEANETTLADPNVEGIYSGSDHCLTQVVCCPSIENLRCEDHEYVDDAGNIIDGATTDGDTPEDAASADAPEDAPVPTCKYEIDLTTGTLPCMCKGTLVPDPPSQLLPSCEKKIVCCPINGVICE